MKRTLLTDGAPKAQHILSQGLAVGNTVYVSGQVHVKPDNSLVVGTVEEKINQIMNNIKAILSEAGAGLDDIVKVVVYVTDMSIMTELNEAYPNYFSVPFPVREAVCVKELPLGADIEISVIASVEN
jgi:2-iminobutanoate/2-iminopropanoate deaminase